MRLSKTRLLVNPKKGVLDLKPCHLCRGCTIWHPLMGSGWTRMRRATTVRAMCAWTQVRHLPSLLCHLLIWSRNENPAAAPWMTPLGSLPNFMLHLVEYAMQKIAGAVSQRDSMPEASAGLQGMCLPPTTSFAGFPASWALMHMLGRSAGSARRCHLASMTRLTASIIRTSR